MNTNEPTNPSYGQDALGRDGCDLDKEARIAEQELTNNPLAVLLPDPEPGHHWVLDGNIARQEPNNIPAIPIESGDELPKLTGKLINAKGRYNTQLAYKTLEIYYRRRFGTPE